MTVGRMLIALSLAVVAAGQAQPEGTIEPEIVGEGVISTPHDEFGGAWDVENRTIYFNLSIPKGYLYTICYSTQDSNARWGKPEVMPFSGRYRDSDPVLSTDGKRLYFVSDRPLAGQQQKDFDVYVVDRSANGWGQPRPVSGVVNSTEAEYFASEARNGTLYFTSSRKGSVGAIDVYRAIRQNGEYRQIESLGANINAPGVANIEAFIAPDETYLLLGSFGRPDSVGSADLYISFNHGGTFSKPVHLPGGINTPARDYSPRLSSDGKWFLFASEKSPALATPEHPRTAEQIETIRHSIYNGLGNIYRVPIESLKLSRLANTVRDVP